MRMSRMFLPTMKEAPSDAEVISHILMSRAGMTRRLASGIYDYLPYGLRAIRRFEEIVREEMNRAGAQELLLPGVQPAELWQESGRWELYGKELLRFKDRHERNFCLGPTHEEVITDLVRREVKSYRQLPLNLYQIQAKFRDEIRPRFGLMRGREFIMKDAYSFDQDVAGAEKSYWAMYEAYHRIFTRCGLKFKAVEADTGNIGGYFSHEFMVLADTGEDSILSCNKCSYGANTEKAEARYPRGELPLTADFNSLEKVHTPAAGTVNEVAAFLGVTSADVVKTIILETDQGAVAALVRGDRALNPIKVRNLLDCDWCLPAGARTVEDVSGADVGFAGPVGLKVKLVADNEIRFMKNFVVGANETEYHLKNVNLGRDFEVESFEDLRQTISGDACPRCDGILEEFRGIEVGHVFMLGTKYSKALRAVYLNEAGQEADIVMGCYGIGIGRTIAAAIEQNHDENGIIFPLPLAPYPVVVLPLNVKEKEVLATAERIYAELMERGVEAVLDDRDERAGVKFNDADLCGFPLRITIGARGLKEGKIEIKGRAEKAAIPVEVGQATEKIKEMINEAMISFEPSEGI